MWLLLSLSLALQSRPTPPSGMPVVGRKTYTHDHPAVARPRRGLKKTGREL